MDAIEVLREQFSRVPQLVRGAVEGLSAVELQVAPADDANTIGWLVWHLARVQDAQVADLAGSEQVYVTGRWGARFERESDPADTGFGHDAGDVRAVRPASSRALIDYVDAVHEATLRFLGTLSEADLDRVVDDAWDPPVTLGVRLVSIVDDDVQHAGQAAYVRGLLGIEPSDA